MQNTLGNSFEDEFLTLSDTNFTKMNLFFIKSKHVFRQFKNHDYFENTRNPSFSHKINKQRQFVECPTPYGINNAYNYVCTEISKNLLQKPQKRQARTITDFKTFNQTKIKKINMLQTEPRRKSNSIFPNLSNLQQKKCQFIQDTLSQDSFKNQTKKEKVASKIQELLTFLFISKSTSAQKWKATQIKINIYPHIVNTFLKSRINYYQMTQNQFCVLKSFIVGIFQTEKEYVEYKDMVNIKSIKEIFNTLQSQNYSQTYKKEMVRYFFIANTLTYEYQLNKLKDQIKTLVSYKFNKDIKNDEIFIYQANTSTEITNLHQLLKHNGPIIFGLDCKILNLYNKQIQEKEAQNLIENRIKRWKSIAPEENIRFQTHISMPADKYQTLFNNVRRKREKFTKNKKKPGMVLKTSQFIDRTKLVKNDDIFQ